MWIEIINEFRKENKNMLDLNFELHLTLYIYELLKSLYDFSIDEDNDNLIIKKDDKIITISEFYYWWQITRYDEIFNEEKKIFNEFQEFKKKCETAINKIKYPEISEDEKDEKKSKKITELNNKKEKLQKVVKEKADSSNKDINALKNFRVLLNSKSLLDKFIENLKIVIVNKI